MKKQIYNNPLAGIAVSIFLVVALAVGCASLPKVAELPDIPAYNDTQIKFEEPVKIGIMVCSSYMGNIRCAGNNANRIQAAVAQTIDRQQVCAWLAREIAKTGAEIHISDYNTYITRQDRLALEKIIRVTDIQPRCQYARDGFITDVKVSLSIHHNNATEAISEFEVWGRHVHPARTKNQCFDLALQNAFANLISLPGFADAVNEGHMTAQNSREE